MRKLAAALTMLLLVATLLLVQLPAVRAQEEATPTYTPIATRTPAATAITGTLEGGTTYTLDSTITDGDVLIISGIFGLACMFLLYWGYRWVVDHIRIAE